MGARGNKVIATIQSTDGLTFNLFRTYMLGVPVVPGNNVHKSTRRQIARAFTVVGKTEPGRGEEKSGKFVWALVSYSVQDPTGVELNTSRAYSRASTRTVHIGCQRFIGKNARILREWATA